MFVRFYRFLEQHSRVQIDLQQDGSISSHIQAPEATYQVFTQLISMATELRTHKYKQVTRWNADLTFVFTVRENISQQPWRMSESHDDEFY